MNILYYYEYNISPTRGGTERVTSVIANELNKRGFCCMYISMLNHGDIEINKDTKQYYLPNNKCLESIENEVYLHAFLQEHNIKIIINQDATNFASAFFSKNRFPEVRIISCIHYNLWGGINYIGDTFKYTYIHGDISYITYLIKQTLIPFYKLRAIHRLSKYYRQLVENSDSVIVLSEDDRLEYPVKEKSSIYTIANPITIEYPASLPTKEKIILWVGRMTFSPKRADYLLKVWHRIQDNHPDWRVEMLREGNCLECYKDEAKRLGLRNIYFRGRVNPIPYYERASIFCMTSTYEGFGLVLTEAMSYGCVPIAFDSFAAVHDIITNKKDGYLVEPFSVCKYAKTLESLMQDEDLRLAISHNCIDKIKNFSLSNIVDKWECLFKEYVSGDCNHSV